MLGPPAHLHHDCRLILFPALPLMDHAVALRRWHPYGYHRQQYPINASHTWVGYNYMDCSRNLADLQNATNDSNQNMSIRMNFTTNTSADLYIISTCEQDLSNLYAS